MPRFAREPSREDNNTPDLFHSNKKEKKKRGKKGNKKGGEERVEYARPSYRRPSRRRGKRKRLTGRPTRIRVLIFSTTVINQRTNLFL